MTQARLENMNRLRHQAHKHVRTRSVHVGGQEIIGHAQEQDDSCG